MKNKGSNSNYFTTIKEAVSTSVTGAKITLKHLVAALKNPRNPPTSANDPAYFQNKDGIVTLRYPFESIPVPDNGRYKLHNEIDDCIVCDKCAKVCPVDCIDIEVIKSPEVFGETSDGTPKRLYAEKFDIDMAKCCFCGLCTTVCPTECLTMTKEYDFSTFDLGELNFRFSEMSPEEAEEKKRAYEAAQAKKQAVHMAKTAAESVNGPTPSQGSGAESQAKPVVKRARPALRNVPKNNTAAAPAEKPAGDAETNQPSERPRPVIVRKSPDNQHADSTQSEPTKPQRPRPIIRKKKEE